MRRVETDREYRKNNMTDEEIVWIKEKMLELEKAYKEEGDDTEERREKALCSLIEEGGRLDEDIEMFIIAMYSIREKLKDLLEQSEETVPVGDDTGLSDCVCDLAILYVILNISERHNGLEEYLRGELIDLSGFWKGELWALERYITLYMRDSYDITNVCIACMRYLMPVDYANKVSPREPQSEFSDFTDVFFVVFSKVTEAAKTKRNPSVITFSMERLQKELKEDVIWERFPRAFSLFFFSPWSGHGKKRYIEEAYRPSLAGIMRVLQKKYSAVPLDFRHIVSKSDRKRAEREENRKRLIDKLLGLDEVRDERITLQDGDGFSTSYYPLYYCVFYGKRYDQALRLLEKGYHFLHEGSRGEELCEYIYHAVSYVQVNKDFTTLFRYLAQECERLSEDEVKEMVNPFVDTVTERNLYSVYPVLKNDFPRVYRAIIESEWMNQLSISYMLVHPWTIIFVKDYMEYIVESCRQKEFIETHKLNGEQEWEILHKLCSGDEDAIRVVHCIEEYCAEVFSMRFIWDAEILYAMRCKRQERYYDTTVLGAANNDEEPLLVNLESTLRHFMMAEYDMTRLLSVMIADFHGDIMLGQVEEVLTIVADVVENSTKTGKLLCDVGRLEVELERFPSGWILDLKERADRYEGMRKDYKEILAWVRKRI